MVRCEAPAALQVAHSPSLGTTASTDRRFFARVEAAKVLGLQMSFYAEARLEEFDWDEASQTYFYLCPCGDRFQITLDELMDGEEIARCPSCSLQMHVLYEVPN